MNSTGGFANGGTNDTDTLGYVALSTGLGQPGRMATEITPLVREIVMGTVTLTAPTVGATVFSIQDHDLINNGDFATFSTVSLEAAATASGGSFNGRSLTLAAVPEPSGLMLIGLGIGLALVRRRSKLR